MDANTPPSLDWGIPPPVPASEEYFQLGTLHYEIHTSSPDAQIWFDRGLAWTFGFNHDEAVYCYKQVLAHDPKCAMGWWGLSYRTGGNYNNSWKLMAGMGLIVKSATMAKAAIESAQSCQSSGLDASLISALAERYPVPEDMDTFATKYREYDEKYAQAMRKVYEQYGRDDGPPHFIALFAEALMLVTPWNLWEDVTGKPTKGSHGIEAKNLLESAMQKEKLWLINAEHAHPGIHHYYIHLMERSAEPELALPSADKLRNLWPDAGHLNHMPSHIDNLVGNYRDSVVANARGIEADLRFLSKSKASNIALAKAFMCHNAMVGIYAAMLSGQSEVAMHYATLVSDTWLDRESVAPFAFLLEPWVAVKIHVLVRFGRWDEIKVLDVPEDQAFYPYTTAMTYYARGIAYAATSQVDKALEERASLVEAIDRVPPHWLLLSDSRAKDVLQIPLATLDGEIAYRQGDYPKAWAELEQAIKLYDNLAFGEPWPWMQSVRHAYAALKLEQGEVEDALNAYAGDLGYDKTITRGNWHPGNVWALQGYHECLVKLGRQQEAKLMEPQLVYARAVADIKIDRSCFCRTKVSSHCDEC